MYITISHQQTRQISLICLLTEMRPEDLEDNPTGWTHTRIVEKLPASYFDRVDVENMIVRLEEFTAKHEALYNVPRQNLYRTFFIPKRSGGMRRIDAPNEALSTALRELRDILEKDFGMLYHTSAFAYVKNRSCVDAVKKHQRNKSNWFLKLDFSNFFGSSTPEFVLRMLCESAPCSLLAESPRGKRALEKALDLCFLNGGLPQGTPISPTLTNIMMIPIDHRLFNTLQHHRVIYTRYADDLLISSVQRFDPDKMTDFIRKTLREFGAPFTIKDEKTRYGSRKGSNWNLGVMLNQDNNITVGHMKKKHLKAALCNLIMDWQNGKRWPAEDAQSLGGTISWYRSVEPAYIDYVIAHMNAKFHADVHEIIKKTIAGE